MKRISRLLQNIKPTELNCRRKSSGKLKVKRIVKVLDFSSELIYNTRVADNRRHNMRGWRNWQTRTFEGRVGNHTGSSPVLRTKKETSFVYQDKRGFLYTENPAIVAGFKKG